MLKEGLIKDSFELILKEIQTIITLLYIFAVAIGMLFNYQKYQAFGINIFEYSDFLDFLIAPFADFYIVGFLILSTIIPLFAIWFDFISRQKWPRFFSKIYLGFDKKPWFRSMQIATYTLLILVYVIYSSYYYGNFAKNRVQNQPEITITFADGAIEKGKVIGKTKEVMFLLVKEKVKVIPITSLVKEIEL